MTNRTVTVATSSEQRSQRPNVWRDSLVGIVASAGVGLTVAVMFTAVVFALVYTAG
jgi:hypothetical protein